MIKLIKQSPAVPTGSNFTPVDIMQDIPSTDEYPMSAESDVISDPAKIDPPINMELYSDPKYLAVVAKLEELGYVGSRFLGASGYYIPEQSGKVKLVCPSLEEGFLINIQGSRSTVAVGADYISGIMKITKEIDELNFILAGATDSSTQDRHVNESVIEIGNPEYGKPGLYVAYRNGGDKTERGLISFSCNKADADQYAKDGSPTKKYLINITNPYVTSGKNAFTAFAEAYIKLTDKSIDIDADTKVNDMWRECDKEMSEILKEKGHDALIYIVPNANEILVVGTDINEVPSINAYEESVRHVADASINEGIVDQAEVDKFVKIIEAKYKEELSVYKHQLASKLKVEYKDYLDAVDLDMTVDLGENMRLQLESVFKILIKSDVPLKK